MNFGKTILSAIIFIIAMFSTVCLATETISRINFELFYVIEGHDQVKDIKAPKGVKIVGYTWLDKEEKRFMAEGEKYKLTHFYAIRMFFEPADGYEFKDNLLVTVMILKY